jgi:nitrilase
MVAVVQMASTMNVEENFENVRQKIQTCSERGAQLICLPENFACHGSEEGRFLLANNRKWFHEYRQLALDNQVWLSLGSFPEPCPNEPTRHF